MIITMDELLTVMTITFTLGCVFGMWLKSE
jgi:hypothetical protein